MQKFTIKIVDMMKAEKLFQTQGGPIILSQVSYANECPRDTPETKFFIFILLLQSLIMILIEYDDR